MSTRFGGVSKNKQQQQIKTALLVCGLLFAVLIGALFFLVQSPEQGSSSTQSVIAVTPVEVLPQQNSDSVKVLVTRQRIEEGAQINEAMFEATEWDPNNVPSGAILDGKLQPILTQKMLYAAHMMGARVPLLESSVTEVQPISAIDIPPGHRAVTINIDNRSGVEGWARPNSRVDVLWTHVGKDGKKRVISLVPYAKVLLLGGNSAGGQPQAGAGTKSTVTLLVTIQQAKKIELARTLGDLSLSLVGDVEPIGESEGGDAITEAELLGLTGEDKQEEIPADGVMYDTDPVTGKKRKFLLMNGRWKLDAE